MKYRQTLLIVSLWLCQASTLLGQNTGFAQWAIHDFPFKANVKVADPFSLKFGAVFQHTSGFTMDIPGFYDGENTWVVRFSPTLTGKWSYLTYSSAKALTEKSGVIEVTPNTKPDRHGAITIHPRYPQRFAYEDGSPFLPIAFEIDWLFALDAQEPDGLPKTSQIVDAMVANGFNNAIMNVYAYDAGWGQKEKIDAKYNFAKPKIFPFGQTNEAPDHTTLNIEFFRHLDRVMAHLHQREVAAHLMIYVWNKQVNWPKPMSENDNRYFDYVVKRYQAYPNLLWDISKEALAYGMDDMAYIADRISRLRQLDAHKRLVTVHDYAFCQAYPDLVDFISVQEWRPNLYNEMLAAVQQHPKKPVFNVEHGGYEETMHTIFHGAYTDAVVCLERSYTCMFAGTYTTYYWQNSSWYELVYQPFSLPEEQQPKFIFYKYMRAFFEQFSYDKLIPTQYFYSPFCLTNQQDVFLFLLPGKGYALEGSAPKELVGKAVSIQWFDPLTGKYSEVIQRNKMGDWLGFTKPQGFAQDFVIAIIRTIE